VNFHFQFIYQVDALYITPTNIFCFCGTTYMSLWELVFAYPNGGQWASSATFPPRLKHLDMPLNLVHFIWSRPDM